MSITQPLWDAEIQGWRGEPSGGTYRVGPRSPWLRRLVQRRRARPKRPWSRRSRFTEQPAVGWNQSSQGWETKTSSAAAFWSTTRLRHGWALLLLLAASTVALLAGWWSGALFLVWTSLVTTGVVTVRRQAAVEAGVRGGRGEPVRDPAPVTPERAFAEGALTVLLPSRLITPAREPSRPLDAPPPRESSEAHVAAAVQDVCARLAAAARTGEDIS